MTRFLSLFLLLISFFNVNAKNGLGFVGTISSGCLVNTNQTPVTGNAARTVEAWIKLPTSSLNTQKVILDMGNMLNGGRFTLMLSSTNRLMLEVGGDSLIATTVLSDNNWHHVAATYNPINGTGQKAKLYVDGVMQVQGDFIVTVSTAASPTIRMGCRNNNTNYFNGVMDEVRVWSGERTASEIANSRGNELCSVPTTGLIAHYKLNEGFAGGVNTSISTVVNSAFPSIVGTLTGFLKSGNTSNFVLGAPINGATYDTMTASACATYRVPSNKRSYSASGTFNDTVANANGCDSVLTITLTVNGLMPIANLAVSNVTSLSATISWDSVTNATGYEYALTTSATPPSSGMIQADTFYNAIALAQNTTYYFHVRINCGVSNQEIWRTVSFKTDPACYAVTGLTISNITTVAATFSWDSFVDAMWYEYLITPTSAAPNPNVAGSGTFKTTYTTTALYPNNTYYFHLRQKCNNNLYAPWITEPFTTLPIASNVNDVENSAFTLSPNPSQGQVLITLNQVPTNNEVKIVVFDVFGKRVKSLTSQKNQKTISLDLGEQPSGVYYLRMNDGEQQYVKQLVLTR